MPNIVIIEGYNITAKIIEDLAKEMKPGETCGNLIIDGHNYTWAAYDLTRMTEAP